VGGANDVIATPTRCHAASAIGRFNVIHALPITPAAAAAAAAMAAISRGLNGPSRLCDHRSMR